MIAITPTAYQPSDYDYDYDTGTTVSYHNYDYNTYTTYYTNGYSSNTVSKHVVKLTRPYIQLDLIQYKSYKFRNVYYKHCSIVRKACFSKSGYLPYRIRLKKKNKA